MIATRTVEKRVSPVLWRDAWGTPVVFLGRHAVIFFAVCVQRKLTAVGEDVRVAGNVMRGL